MTNPRVYYVLFLCTGNSARSILAEVLLNRIGRDRFHAFSAGSHPKGTVHPLALELLEHRAESTAGLRSKAWDEFAEPGAPTMDFVFTVCSSAAGEQCPIWPGQPMQAHWGIDDPAAVSGTENERRTAFLRAYTELEARIRLFTSLRVEQLDRMALEAAVRRIGETT